MKQVLCACVLLLSMARAAAAQTAPIGPPVPSPLSGGNAGIGEKYWIEFSYTFWQPTLDGNIMSDSLGVVGSRVDLTSDLSLASARFHDFRVVLRPSKRNRIKFQYTPIEFTGSGVLSRDITFAGVVYPISLPVESLLDWKVFRVGYEYDFYYKPRGFIGVLVSAGTTSLKARIDSIIGSAEATGTEPLVEIGAAGRFYPIRNLAINAEGSGIKLTDLEPDSMLKTMSWDLSATYNFTNNVGVSGGWRRLNTDLKLDADSAKLDFRGFWFGGVVRY
jgi:hypothetical protein